MVNVPDLGKVKVVVDAAWPDALPAARTPTRLPRES